MTSDLLLAVPILIGVIGVVLLIDLARVRAADSDAISDPERQQLVVALAMMALAGAFFAGRAGGDASAAGVPPAEPQATRPDEGGGASLARFADAARLPSLQVPERKPKPKPEKPAEPKPDPDPVEPAPVPEEVPVAQPEEVDPPVAEPVPAPAPEPAPAPAPDPDPAPAPDPEPPPVAFDDSG